MLAVFAVAFLAALSGYAMFAWRLEGVRRSTAVRRLARKPREDKPRRTESLLTDAAAARRGRLALRLLERVRLKERADALLETAGLRWSAARLLHICLCAFIAGFAAVSLATGNRYPVFAALAGCGAMLLPVGWVRRQARRRVDRFEEQFADCLEFIARSMRAGHAFSVSLEMIHKEFQEPVAAEFRRAFEEQNLGLPLEVVLAKLGRRVPSMDVHFFVSAVLLQKRTGGNLAEILDKLGYVIRERFKLRGRIRAISAHGRLSGVVLTLIPIVVALLMFLVNPQYARFFVEDPVGHALLAATVGLQLVGYLIIRKVVNIEV
ncbi:MAG: type II secretion system F family protein [Bryobacteraceae bacterium]